MPTPRKLNFVGIGFQKCGTSSLADYLKQDSAFALPVKKELHYFCNCEMNDKNNQLEQFLKGCDSEQIIGEVTPCYIRSEVALRNLKKYNSDLKLIICLRNPIDRFVSAYIHASKIGAIPEQITPEYLIQLEDLHSKYSWIDEIVSQGRYANYIQTVWKYFPKKNTKILFLEELESGKLIPNEIKKFLNPGYSSRKRIKQRYPSSNTHVEKQSKVDSKYFLKINHKIKNNFKEQSQVNTLTPLEILDRCEKLLEPHYANSNKTLTKLLKRDLPWG
jgi:hypothetical protein